jgi:hypothetical protein
MPNAAKFSYAKKCRRAKKSLKIRWFFKNPKLASLKQFGFTSLSCLLSMAFGELASSFLYEKQSDFLN